MSPFPPVLFFYNFLFYQTCFSMSCRAFDQANRENNYFISSTCRNVPCIFLFAAALDKIFDYQMEAGFPVSAWKKVNGAIDGELRSYGCVTAAYLFDLEMFLFSFHPVSKPTAINAATLKLSTGARSCSSHWGVLGCRSCLALFIQTGGVEFLLSGEKVLEWGL